MIELTQAPYGEYAARKVLIPKASIIEVTEDHLEDIRWVKYGDRTIAVLETLDEIKDGFAGR